MSMRTDGVTFAEDEAPDFSYTGEVTKAYVDENTGLRYIVGAATGIKEDRDGERVSKRAIAKMLDQINKGGVVVTGSHQQDWMTTFGKTVAGELDPETDQMMVKTELPPEGVDPIADKAWTEVNKRPLGWSIGGKLRGAYHELTEVGKKRKVLDAIDLRHLMLTENPSSTETFAQAVAKTFTGEPADDAFVDETVAKDTTGSWTPGGGGNSGQDSETGGKRNAGSKKKPRKGMNVDDDGSEGDEEKDELEDDDDEGTVEPAERHMSCPQCGHEFAADIPVDMTPEEREQADERKDALEDHVPGDKFGAGDEDKDNGDGDGEEPNADGGKPEDDDDQEEEKKPPKGKSTSKTKEAPVDLEKRMNDLEATVAKIARGESPETPEKETPAAEVEKTAGEGIDKDVLRLVAVATGEVDDRVEKTRQELSEGFEILGKALMEVREAVGQLPTGRKSVSHAQVLKSGKEGGSDADTVEKAIEELGEDASPTDILKAMNRVTYGIQ